LASSNSIELATGSDVLGDIGMMGMAWRASMASGVKTASGIIGATALGSWHRVRHLGRAGVFRRRGISALWREDHGITASGSSASGRRSGGRHERQHRVFRRAKIKT